MGTGTIQPWICDNKCKPMTNVWRTDLVVKNCEGAYLVDFYPEIIDQLKQRYAKPAVVTDVTNYGTATDQSGNTIDLTVTGYALQTLTFSSPAQTPNQICQQMANFFQGVKIYLKNDHIVIESLDRGPGVTITIGGTNTLNWFIATGGGWIVKATDYYCGEKRIQLIPPSPEKINHVTLDVPPGCYIVWTRCCFGNNEETSKHVVQVRCGEEICFKLLLPTAQLCGGEVIMPAMDHIVQEQNFYDDERLIMLRGFMAVARLDKAAVLARMNLRRAEAEDAGLADKVALVDAQIAIANMLPECC